MRQKIENLLRITCEDIDLTTLTNIEFYIKQHGMFSCYIPTVISPTEMTVKIPKEDAMTWSANNIELQFAFTDADGNPGASDVIAEKVERLLKEAGYDTL